MLGPLDFHGTQRGPLGTPLLDGQIERPPSLPPGPTDEGGQPHDQPGPPGVRGRMDRPGPDLQRGGLTGPHCRLHQREGLRPLLTARWPCHGLGQSRLEPLAAVPLRGRSERRGLPPEAYCMPLGFPRKPRVDFEASEGCLALPQGDCHLGAGRRRQRGVLLGHPRLPLVLLVAPPRRLYFTHLRGNQGALKAGVREYHNDSRLGEGAPSGGP
jgi:hypothetical protein